MGGTDGYILGDGDVELNPGRRTIRLTVQNTGDRPVQVGSHYHFFEVNRALVFDRAQAFGMRLNIPAGTAVRFEPGSTREVELVAYGGQGIAWGFAGLVQGSTRTERNRRRALARVEIGGGVIPPAGEAE